MPCRVLARSCRDLISWGCQRLCSGIWQTHCHCGCLFGRLLGRLQQPDLYIIVSSYRRSTAAPLSASSCCVHVFNFAVQLRLSSAVVPEFMAKSNYITLKEKLGVICHDLPLFGRLQRPAQRLKQVRAALIAAERTKLYAPSKPTQAR